MAETTTNQNVDEYMGQQVTNPAMPSQGQYAPQSQNIQPGEEVSPEAYGLQGEPALPISQAQTALANAPTVSPAATVDPSLVGTATPTATAQTGTLSTDAQATAAQGTLSNQAQALVTI